MGHIRIDVIMNIYRDFRSITLEGKLRKGRQKISLFYFNVIDYESVLIMEFELHSREKKDRLNCMIWLVAKVDN